MRTVTFNLPTLGFVVATRAMLAAGVGLLVSSKIPEARRRTIGSILVAIGAVSTIPAARTVLSQLRTSASTGPDRLTRPELSAVQQRLHVSGSGA